MNEWKHCIACVQVGHEKSSSNLWGPLYVEKSKIFDSLRVQWDDVPYDSYWYGQECSLCSVVWHIIRKMRPHNCDLLMTPICLSLWSPHTHSVMEHELDIYLVVFQTMILCVKLLKLVLPPWNCECICAWNAYNVQKIMKCLVVSTQGEPTLVNVTQVVAYHTYFWVIWTDQTDSEVCCLKWEEL